MACVSVHGANRLGGNSLPGPGGLWSCSGSASTRVYRRTGRIARCQRSLMLKHLWIV
nr:hypothetical protein [Escherichia coli]